MNAFDLIRKIQMKMNDPAFAAKFNNASSIINNTPGLQQEIMRIAQMSSEKDQAAAIARLPKHARDAVQEIINLLNG